MFGRGRTGQNCSQFKIGHCKFQIRPRRPLLLLLGVKRGLLSQQFSDQFFGPIDSGVFCLWNVRFAQSSHLYWDTFKIKGR